MIVRIYNKIGMNEVEKTIQACAATSSNLFTDEFLSDPRYSSELDLGIEIERRPFRTRYELASYLVGQLELTTNRRLHMIDGLWTWIATFYFDAITSRRKNGTLRVGSMDKYIAKHLSMSGRKQRHAIHQPCRLIQELGEVALTVLDVPPHGMGDLYDGLGDHREVIFNHNFHELLTYLFYDTARMRKRPSANDRDKIRRFFQLMKQINMTRDIEIMGLGDFLNAIPDYEVQKIRI
jgi:hypothetical protein